MRLSRVQISNFRNFAALDVALSDNVVLVGENRVGKSNFILALRLVLDPSLPDSARQLKFSDIWDGHDPDTEPEINIHLDFVGFDGDKALLALLTDHRLASDHTVARLSYLFRKKADIEGPARSEADYDFKVYGGGDEARAVSSEVRRRLCIDVLHALRDAEGELGAWRSSPLRPLLDEASGRVPEKDLTAVASDVDAATKRINALQPIKELEESLRKRVAALAGTTQDIHPTLGFAPTDPLRLLRSIRVFIDDGKRAISDASVGSANLALLAFKLAEFDWRRQRNERNFTLMCIEEPEAHLHPHLQRQVFQKLFGETTAETHRSLLLTTHSPNIASVAPLRSMVVLKEDGKEGSRGYSLADLRLSDREFEDLQRYLNVTRAEILFSRGVVFVEGDAEAALVPVFAQAEGWDLDALGITVCNVGGTHFSAYVSLALRLGLRFSIITDWDPLGGGKRPLGWDRSFGLIEHVLAIKGPRPLKAEEKKQLLSDEQTIRDAAAKIGIFSNTETLEVEIAKTPGLVKPLLAILEAENFGPKRQARLAGWKADPKTIDGEQLLAMIADVGKGRLSARLAEKAVGLKPPEYIRNALKRVVDHG